MTTHPKNSSCSIAPPAEILKNDRTLAWGAVLGIGRLGAAASAWVGARAVDAGGAAGFFILFAAAVAASTIAGGLVRQSIPAQVRSPGL